MYVTIGLQVLHVCMLPLELINYLAWVHAIPWAHNIPEEAIPVVPTQLTYLHVHISESCQLKAGRAIHVPSPDSHARIQCSSSLKLLPWTSILHVWLPRLPACTCTCICGSSMPMLNDMYVHVITYIVGIIWIDRCSVGMVSHVCVCEKEKERERVCVWHNHLNLDIHYTVLTNMVMVVKLKSMFWCLFRLTSWVS